MKWCFLSIVLNILLAIAAFSCTEHYSVLAFWFMIYINVVIFGLIIKTSGLEIDFLEPYYVVLAIFTLYAWTSALAEVNGNGKFLSIMPIYYRCTILGIVGFMLGYRYIHYSKLNLIKSLTSFNPNISFVKFYQILLLSTIIFSIFNYKSLINIFNISNISPYTEVAASSRLGRTASSGVFEYIQELSILLILGSLFIRSFVKKKLSIIGTIVFGLYAVIGIMSGGKSLVISFFTLLLIYFNYNDRRLRLMTVVIYGLVLITFSTILSHVRSTTSIPEMAKLAVDLSKADLKYLTPLASGELINPPRTAMHVIDSIQNGYMKFSFGSTYISDLAIFIPKIFSPDRPPTVPERFMEIFYPVELNEGKGQGNYMITEGYWAFGQIGVLIAMFIYGAIVSIYYEILKRNLNNGVMIFIYYLAYFPLITTATRTGLIGAIKGTVMVVVPFLLILFISRKWLKVERFLKSKKPEIVHGSKLAASQ